MKEDFFYFFFLFFLLSYIHALHERALGLGHMGMSGEAIELYNLNGKKNTHTKRMLILTFGLHLLTH